MKRFFFALLFMSCAANANVDEDYLNIAAGTKAIIDAGYDISNMLGAKLLYPADFETHHCVLITTEITINPACPERFPEENTERGFMSCVKRDGVRQTKPSGIQTTCME